MIQTTNEKNDSNDAFLQLLIKEANVQTKLSQKTIVPAQLHPLTSFIAIHSWKVVASIAFITALLVEVVVK